MNKTINFIFQPKIKQYKLIFFKILVKKRKSGSLIKKYKHKYINFKAGQLTRKLQICLC